MLDSLAELNHRTFERYGDPETQTRISQYEMAFRMQSSVPELVDVSGETQATLDMYGPGVRNPALTQPAHCWLVAWWNAVCESGSDPASRLGSARFAAE